MVGRRFIVAELAHSYIFWLVALAAACSNGHATAPTAVTPSHSVISITSMTISGEALTVGYAYHVLLHLRESAGVAATISSADLTVMQGGTAIASCMMTGHSPIRPMSCRPTACWIRNH